jgi:hypothetical protein
VRSRPPARLRHAQFGSHAPNVHRGVEICDIPRGGERAGPAWSTIDM